MLFNKNPVKKIIILNIVMLFLLFGFNDSAHSGKWKRMMRRRSFQAIPAPKQLVPVPNGIPNRPAPKRFSIELHNRYEKEIYAAVLFRDIKDKWVTKGWYLLKPDQKIKVAITENLIVYSYAESKAPLKSRKTWDGTKQPKESRNFSIRESENKYSFRLHDFSDKSSEGVLTIPFVTN